MKKKWIAIVLICVLVAATVGVGLYVRARQVAQEKQNAITLKAGGKEIVVAIKDLDKGAFEGETVNGKGERSAHAYRGVELLALLQEKGIDAAKITGVTAVSADQYTAELTGDEVRTPGRVYLAVEIDSVKVSGIDAGADGVQMIVFGDENMRRSVRNLAVIEAAE